jgi:hypothetical protein
VQVHLLSENRGSALETGTMSRIKMVSSMKEMSEVCSDSLLHSIIGMLTTWSAAQGHSHSILIMLCSFQLPRFALWQFQPPSQTSRYGSFLLTAMH